MSAVADADHAERGLGEQQLTTLRAARRALPRYAQPTRASVMRAQAVERRKPEGGGSMVFGHRSASAAHATNTRQSAAVAHANRRPAASSTGRAHAAAASHQRRISSAPTEHSVPRSAAVPATASPRARTSRCTPRSEATATPPNIASISSTVTAAVSSSSHVRAGRGTYQPPGSLVKASIGSVSRALARKQQAVNAAPAVLTPLPALAVRFSNSPAHLPSPYVASGMADCTRGTGSGQPRSWCPQSAASHKAASGEWLQLVAPAVAADLTHSGDDAPAAVAAKLQGVPGLGSSLDSWQQGVPPHGSPPDAPPSAAEVQALRWLAPSPADSIELCGASLSAAGDAEDEQDGVQGVHADRHGAHGSSGSPWRAPSPQASPMLEAPTPQAVLQEPSAAATAGPWEAAPPSPAAEAELLVAEENAAIGAALQEAAQMPLGGGAAAGDTSPAPASQASWPPPLKAGAPGARAYSAALCEAALSTLAAEGAETGAAPGSTPDSMAVAPAASPAASHASACPPSGDSAALACGASSPLPSAKIRLPATQGAGAEPDMQAALGSMPAAFAAPPAAAGSAACLPSPHAGAGTESGTSLPLPAAGFSPLDAETSGGAAPPQEAAQAAVCSAVPATAAPAALPSDSEFFTPLQAWGAGSEAGATPCTDIERFFTPCDAPFSVSPAVAGEGQPGRLF